MSCRKVFQNAPFDFHAYQRSMPDRVAAYFRTKPLNWIMWTYDVTERTARNWKEGIVVPNGGTIAAIAYEDREGFDAYFDPEQGWAA